MRKVVDTNDSKLSAVVHWDYRMMLADNGEWSIREVFYDKDDAVLGWASYPAVAWGDTPEELAGVLTRMQEAADRPPLVEADLPDGAFTGEQPLTTKESDNDLTENLHPDIGGV